VLGNLNIQETETRSCTEINSRYIKYLNVRPENLKLQEKHGEKLNDIGLGNNFLKKIPIAQQIRP
jgi:hypothetical protein